MRISLDLRVYADPRTKRLARLSGWDVPKTVGVLGLVWGFAYQARSARISAEDVDDASDAPGLAARMCEAKLAKAEPDGLVYLHGVQDRIGFLLAQAERGRSGGLAKAKREASDRSASALASPSAPDIASASAPDIAPELASGVLADPPPGKSKPKARKPKAGGYLASLPADQAATVRVVLEKLGARCGVVYQGADPHTRLIVARLEDGATEHDLRCVVGYCADKSGLGWQSDDKLRAYLRPETLFGPVTIAKYLEPARAWAAKHAKGPTSSPAHAGATITHLVPPRGTPEIKTPQIAAQSDLAGFHFGEEEAS